MERKEDYRWTEESENMNDWPRDTTTSHRDNVDEHVKISIPFDIESTISTGLTRCLTSRTLPVR